MGICVIIEDERDGANGMKSGIETGKTPRFSHQCFWDMDSDKLDFSKGRNYIISRVIQNGNYEDVKALFAYYGSNAIKEEVIKIRYLDDKTLNMMSLLFNIEKTKFRCFNNRERF